MARVTVQQNNFTAGEITPKMYGRTDVARYQTGAKEITNGLVQLHGGIKRRPGTLHHANARDTGDFRLLRFVYGRDQVYCIEFGAGYFRFHTDTGPVLDVYGNPYEVSNEYTESELWDVTYFQNGSIMYFAHGSHKTKQLQIITATSWTFSDVAFSFIPTKEDIFVSKYKLTLSQSAIGENIVATSPFFNDGNYRRDAKGNNMSRKIYSNGGGEAIFTGIVSTTGGYKVKIIKAFESTEIAANEWWLEGQPQTQLAIVGGTAVGSNITLTKPSAVTPSNTALTVADAVETTVNGLRAAQITITSAGSLATNSHIKRIKLTYGDNNLWFTPFDVYNAGLSAYIYMDNNDLPVEELVGLAGIMYDNINTVGTTVGGPAHPEHIGSNISINGGIVEVVGVNFGQYLGVVRKALNSTVTAIENSWAIQLPVWTETAGYPKAVSSYQQRLVLASNRYYPNTVWMSSTGSYYDFLLGTLDDDAIAFNVASTEQSEITHFAHSRELMAFTINGEYSFEGGVDSPITPTNVQIRNQYSYGCSKVRPVKIGSEIYYVQRAGRKIRALAYKDLTESPEAPDLSVMAEHLTVSGIKDMTFQAEPNSTMWIVRNDGVLVSATIERDQDVVAWAEHETSGTVLSVCSVPGSSSDVVFVGVTRNGTRRIERMSESIYMDASISGTASPATDTWSGLDHLEGLTVNVLADGVVLGSHTVSGGSVTLTRTASTVQIGLDYTVTIVPLTQDIQTSTGSSIGNAQRVSEVSLRFMDTVGCKVNGDWIAFSQYNQQQFGDSVQSFSGIKRIENLGWHKSEDIDITITHDQPLPFHLLSVIYKFQAND